MAKRLLDKNISPSVEDISAFMGANSYALLQVFEDKLVKKYELSKELKFPFGNHYGWGYKYSHKSSHLCYAFFEENAFTVMIQLGDNTFSKVENSLPHLSQKSQELWAGRYPCGTQGGWIHYPVTDQCDLNEILAFVEMKKKSTK